MRSSLVPLVVLCLFAVGCGGVEETWADEAEAGADPEWAQAEDALYGRYSYYCPAKSSAGDGEVGEPFYLILDGDKAKVRLRHESTYRTLSYLASYRNTSTTYDWKKFLGNTTFGTEAIRVEKSLRTGGATLRNGSKGGYATLELRGDGFSSWKSICYRR